MIDDEEDDFDMDLELYECASCGLLYTADELTYRVCDNCHDQQEFNMIRRS